MKLESFGIANFKAFGQDIQRMPLKPITLIYGPNSAGKSSLLQSFLWSLSSATTGDLENRETKIASGSVELGGFRGMLHRHDKERRVQVEFSFDLQNGNQPLRFSHQIGIPGGDDLKRMQRILVSKSPPTEIYREQIKICEASRQKLEELFNWQGLPQQDQLEALLEDADALEERIALTSEQMEEQGYVPFDGHPPDQDQLKKVFHEGEKAWKKILELKPVMGEIAAHCELVDKVIEQEARSASLLAVDIVLNGETILKAIRQPGGANLEIQILDETLIDQLPLPTDAWIEGMLVSTQKLKSGRCCFEGYEINIPQRSDFEILSNEIRIKLFSLMRISQEIAKKTNAELTYLGPLRHLPSRKELLGKVGEQSSDPAIIPWLRIRDQPELRNAVNRALQQILGQPSEFVSKVYASGQDIMDAREEFGSSGWSRTSFDEPLWLDAKAEGFGNLPENPDFDSMLWEDEGDAYQKLNGKLIDKFSTSILVDLGIKDLLHGVTVSFQDVGVGVSQIAPILVHSVANRQKRIAIEQPEIHIHPRLQAELGDVFIESALGGNQNTFLLETHSEHLILRILRRIRETTRGKMNDWPEELRAACPDGIKPEDVAVLYVEPGEDGAKVRELRIDEQGRFIDEWPNGFFEERFNEEF